MCSVDSSGPKIIQTQQEWRATCRCGIFLNLLTLVDYGLHFIIPIVKKWKKLQLLFPLLNKTRIVVWIWLKWSCDVLMNANMADIADSHVSGHVSIYFHTNTRPPLPTKIQIDSTTLRAKQPSQSFNNAICILFRSVDLHFQVYFHFSPESSLTFSCFLFLTVG